MSPGYVRFSKQSLWYQVIENSRKSRQNNLPRGMWFLTEARFEILRPLLHSWHWNEFVGGLSFWFRVPIGLAHETRQQSNWQFTNYLEKMWFWANDSKYRHIIYRWKWFSTTINNMRLLLENKASFGSASLSKFWQFISKNVF